MTINIELDITRECNFQCPSCMRFSNLYNKNPKSIMTLEEIHNIFLQIRQNNIHIYKLLIIGGEPTLHPKFKEICMYLKYIKPAKKIILYTNHSNKSLVNWCSISTDFEIFDNNISHLSINNLKKIKYYKHVNLYLIEKQHINILTVNNCEEIKDCGINIYKYNNQIRYAICGYSTFISRLLQKENEYTFTNIYDCIKFLMYNKYTRNITKFILDNCQYCISVYCLNNCITLNNIKKYKDFLVINDIFKNGYNLILINTLHYK